MGRVTKAERLRFNAIPAIGPDLPEAEHFMECPTCGQLFDMRHLGDALHHDDPDHEPILAAELENRLKFLPPLMPTLSDAPPEGKGWIHEIKYDGYRTQIHVEPRGVRVYTRNAHDWTDRYGSVARAAGRLPCRSAILDGEVVFQDASGRCDFHGLRAAIQRRSPDLVFMAFDLLHLDGRDLRQLPIQERRAELRDMLGPNNPARRIQFSEDISNGAELFAAAEAMELEGIVSKRLGSRYRSGPSKNWLKTKCFMEEELIVVGTERGEKAPVALLARETAAGLAYAGGAMVTLPEAERDRFWSAMERLKAPTAALPMKKRREASWVRPELRVRVRTLRGEEMLRHATVKAMSA